MATPVANKHPSQTSQAVATPPVSTPFSASNHPSHPALNFSPHGPRSVVPSPQQFKRSPANSGTTFGFTGHAGGGGGAGGIIGGYDSPSAAMALGMGMGEMGMGMGMGMDVPTPGAMMGLSVGGGAGGGKGVDGEEERWRRLGVVKEILKVSQGRLSEAGMERLAQRFGLEFVWEANMGSTGSTKTLIVAGQVMALDIDFDNNIVKKVSLAFPDTIETVEKHTAKAGDILLRDLQFEGNESPLTKKLDKFATNLERLVKLDSLSVPGLNCHEAIAGVYETLLKVHQWEVEMLRATDTNKGTDEDWLVREAMCTRSGKPSMHTRERLGMSLDYWQKRRRLGGKDKSNKEAKTWSLLVGCAKMAPEDHMIAPVRISPEWISADMQKANPSDEELLQAPDRGTVLDWLDPEPTFLPKEDAPKAEPMEGVDPTVAQKFPEVMFTAILDPPVIVPWEVASRLYENISPTAIDFPSVPFDSLMLPPNPHDPIDMDRREVRRVAKVPVFGKDGEKSIKEHRYGLSVEKMVYGFTIREIPFSHPSQIVGVLPVLRQYAFLSTLIEKSFGSHTKPEAEYLAQTSKRAPTHSVRDDLRSFLSATSPSKEASSEDTLKLDILFSTQSSLPPQLNIHFPFRDHTANVNLQIDKNGKVQVGSQNVLGSKDGKGKGRDLTSEDLGRMLEVCEDFGVWAEFIRGRFEGD